MAWIQKRGGIWWIGWRHEGVQYRESTGHTDKAEAQKTLAQFDELKRQKHNGTLTDEYYALLTGKPVQKPTLEAHLQSWLRNVTASGITPRTVNKYGQI